MSEDVSKTIERLLNAIDCNEGERGTITRFGDIVFESYSKLGHQAVVLFGKTSYGKQVAVKIYKITYPTAQDQRTYSKIVEDEVSLMLKVQSPCVMDIYSAGTAQFEDDSWSISEGWSKILPFGYFIMPFVPWSAKDIFDRNNIKGNKDKKYLDSIFHRKGEYLFAKLVKDISTAISLCHGSGVYHRDIKLENIRFRPEDYQFILSDFGVGLIEDKEKEYLGYAGKKKDLELEDVRGFTSSLLDVISFIPSGNKPISTLREKTKQEVKGILMGALVDTCSIDYLYETLVPYLEVDGWSMGLHHGACVLPVHDDLFRVDSTIRLPVSGSAPVFEAARRIIDTSHFQRLRGIKQLGPTCYVFPGATHTRFEHSIGVFHTACKYLQKLTTIEGFKNAVGDLNEAIRYGLLSALLHDIGHYPFSHWVEELGDLAREWNLPSHEDRIRKILKISDIRFIIENDWKCQINKIWQIVSDKNPNFSPIVSSIISSSIDCDKIDYLLRDSIHCGVDYGKGIDVDRFIDSIYFNQELKTICLTDKANTIAMVILNCRNTMYREVYWHKTVRSCVGMFKRAFFEAMHEYKKRSECLEKLMMLTDEKFVEEVKTILVRRKKDDYISLLDPFDGGARKIHKVAYTYRMQGETGYYERAFFSRVLSSHAYLDLIKITKSLMAVLEESYFSKEKFDGGDLIIETTPEKRRGDIFNMKELLVFDRRTGSYGALKSQLNVISDMDEYLSESRHAYILVSEEKYAKLDTFNSGQWERIFHKTLEDLDY